MTWDGQERRAHGGSQLEVCKAEHELFARHIQNCEPYKREVDKHTEQIITLFKGEAAILTEVRDIREDIKGIHSNIHDIKLSIASSNKDVKIWILSGVLATMLTVGLTAVGGIMAIGAQNNQIGVNTKKIERLEDRDERLHRVPAGERVP